METACALKHNVACALKHNVACKLKRSTRIWISTLILVLGALVACSPLESTPFSPPRISPLAEDSATLQEPERLTTASPTVVDALTVTASPSSTAPPTAIVTSTATRTPTPLHCLAEGGEITQHTLRTPISPLPWEFRVYTPPCYEQQLTENYPLLVLIHGSTFNDDQWDRLGADEIADALIATGELPPFLILMPRDRVWTDEPKDDPFGQALVEFILPWVDENYRTLLERKYRAIGGLSRGASWAVHLGLSNWEIFGSIGGHSLPVFVTDPPRLRRWLDEIPAEAMPRFFLDIGEKDYLLHNALWFENLLTEKNIPHEWYLYTGRHEEDYWQAHLEQYLRWYAEWWSPPE